jgi:hypothetical protein
MYIYLKDKLTINTDNINIDKHNYTKIYKTYIYSDDGVFVFDKHNFVKINIIDNSKKIIKLNNYTLIKDYSTEDNISKHYQIPLEHIIKKQEEHIYKINNNITFNIVFENNIIHYYFFKLKNDINNYDDIISFLLLVK